MKRLYFTVLLIMLNGPILQADPSTKYNDFEVHHTIFNSMFLNPAIASKYGLRRGENLGVINISVLGKEGHVSRPISGSYKNLLGQQFGLSFRKLVDENAVNDYKNALNIVEDQGGKILCVGNVIDTSGYFVEPTIVSATIDMEITREETFAPILYLFDFESLEDAIEAHNSVDQGLSSSIFTSDMQSVENFLSHAGSDCGIANVNIGTSGAEIGCLLYTSAAADE